MSRFELYSPEGLRVDGRRYNELRFFNCSTDSTAQGADGNATVQMGTSQVACTVLGPQEPSSRSKVNINKATLSVNVIVAPFSSVERAKHTSNEKQFQELGINLKETFEDVILLHTAPRTEIVVNLYVLAQDGNILAGCVNAMCLALIDAGVPMKEYVMAVAVAVADDVPLLDPCHIEAQELPNLTVGVTGKSSKASLIVLEKRMIIDRFQDALELAIEGCKLIREMMDEEIRGKLESATQKR